MTGAAAGFEVGASLVQPPHALGELLLADDERRQQPHDAVAGGNGQQPAATRRGGESVRRQLQLQADHQPFAADLGDHVGWRSLSSASRWRAIQSRAARRVDEAVGPRIYVEHRVADRHRQRIAAEGRAVDADGQAARRVGGGQARAHRETAADAFGDGHDVGRRAGMLVGEQLAGAADAGLDLVVDQRQAARVAKLPQAAQ